MQSGDLEEAGGELRLRKQPAAPAPAAAAAAKSKEEKNKRTKSNTPSWLVNARRVNVWSVKVSFFFCPYRRQPSLPLSLFSLFGRQPRP